MNPRLTYNPHHAVFCGLSLIIGFAAFRAAALWMHPIVTPEDWVWIDTAKNIPRVLGFGIALWLGLRYWSKERCGFHWGGSRWGLLALLAATGFSVLFHILLVEDPVYIELSLLLLLGFNGVWVALYEELTFRVMLLNGMADWWGNRIAVWGSAFIFMLFHLQAQDLIYFPVLFAWGLLFGFMRMRGIGLYWLILVHLTYDTLVLIADGKKILGSTTTNLVEFVMVFLLIAIFVIVQKIFGGDRATDSL